MSNSTTHTLYINGSHIELTGVNNVITFSDSEIILSLNERTIQLNGEQLDLDVLNVKDGVAHVKGNITSIRYKKSTPKISLLKRITK